MTVSGLISRVRHIEEMGRGLNTLQQMRLERAVEGWAMGFGVDLVEMAYNAAGSRAWSASMWNAWLERLPSDCTLLREFRPMQRLAGLLKDSEVSLSLKDLAMTLEEVGGMRNVAFVRREVKRFHRQAVNMLQTVEGNLYQRIVSFLSCPELRRP